MWTVLHLRVSPLEIRFVPFELSWIKDVLGSRGVGEVKPNFRYRSVMSLAAALGLFPMISEPGGDVRTKWPGTAQRLVCFGGESVKTVTWAERSVS